MGIEEIKLFGKIAQEKGSRNEDRIIEVLKIPPIPDWFRGIEKATHELDNKGIDLVVQTTDVGKIHLQVKSSSAGKEKFIAEHKRFSGAIVVIRPEDSDAIIRGKVISATNQVRKNYLEKRQQK